MSSSDMSEENLVVEMFFDVAKAIAKLDTEIDIEGLFNSNHITKILSGNSVGSKMSELLSLSNPTNGILLLNRMGILKYILPELIRCHKVKQNPQYHVDTVFDHCIKVCLNTPAYLPLRWAGLLHDIGKFAAYSESPTKGITFHKHEVYSKFMTKEIMDRLEVPLDIADEVVFLVNMHMYHYSSEWTDKTVCKFIKTVGIKEDMLDTLDDIPLFRLRYADRISRGLSPSTQKQEDFKERIKKVFSEKYKKEHLSNM